ALARRYLGEEGGRVADARVRDRIAQLEMDQACLDLTLARARDGAKAGHKPGPESSIFKLYGTELNQRRRELMVEILGPQALGWEGPGFADEELKITRDWLRSRGNSIEAAPRRSSSTSSPNACSGCPTDGPGPLGRARAPPAHGARVRRGELVPEAHPD